MRAAYFEGNRTFRVGPCVPVEPGPGQVQIQVEYCGICGTDLHLYHGAMANRLTLPHVMGHEMSGAIASVGSGVAGYQPGEPNCGVIVQVAANDLHTERQPGVCPPDRRHRSRQARRRCDRGPHYLVAIRHAPPVNFEPALDNAVG